MKEFGPAYGTVFTRLDCHPKHGIELLSQSDMFAAEPRGRVIRRDSMREPKRHLVQRGQVLIAGAGTLGENELYGRALLADGRLAGKYVGPDSMTLVFEEPDDDFSLFAYAWLASAPGVQAVRSTSYGTKILRFRTDLLTSLPVPAAPKKIMQTVAELVRTSSKGRETYLSRLLSARSIVDSLPEMREAHELCFDRRSRTLMWAGPFPTLSAWTFASTAGALAHLRKRWAGRLADVVEPNGIFRGGRFPRVPCAPPHGVDFMSQRDAFLIRPIPQRVQLPSTSLLPRPGTIMVGGQGTLGEGEIFGRAALVSKDGASLAWTEHLLRIVPQKGQEARLYTFLTTMVGFRLLRSTAVGTKLLSMRPDLVLALPIPSLSSQSAELVDRHVYEAVEARVVADAAEAEAIRIIEQEVVPQWLA
ncbi:hypothetical protein [Corallococcus carmarthensis]|uniref:hypothetical protein n=1 Tax=Corallococcus carmarthensis TaxID=2316728 RepID=UPI00148CA0C1|nr:hypothetical protein [Corallococcus carmarthensis]NOK18303.1 hypothetical protein [Corallococcus carmarthensis]